MLFSPGAVPRRHGPRACAQLARVLPRKVQEVPGLLQGGIGWQGIVPARAAKMGSIAVDKAIAKLGTPTEFYQQLEPDQIAEHIVAGLRARAARARRRASCAASTRGSGATCPPRGAGRRSSRGSRPSCPGVVHEVTDEIGEHIDQLLDPKIMVIDHFQQNPRAGRARSSATSARRS